jgi:PAS domain S-box-containing protein
MTTAGESAATSPVAAGGDEPPARHERVLRIMLDHMAGGVLMVDASLTITAWNDEYQRLLGLPDGYLAVGRPLEELIRLQCRRGEFGAVDEETFIADFFANMQARTLFERTRPDGTILEFRRNLLPGGGYVAICTDVTERHRKQARIEASERRIRGILEGSPIGAAIASADGRFLFCNSEYARQAGAPSLEAMARVKPADLWVDPAVRSRMFSELRRTGMVRHQEAALRRVDGTTGWCMVSMEQIEYEGENATLAWIYDVSEVRQRSAELGAALARQTATGAILRAMVASPTDTKPVFEMLLRSAVELCDSTAGAIYLFDGERLFNVATHNYPDAALALMATTFPVVPHRGSLASRAFLDRDAVNVADLEAEAGYSARHQQITSIVGVRSFLAVPMMQIGEPVGVIAVHRPSVGGFPETQVDLLRTFADQAVIALGHARMFEELRMARDRAEAATTAKSTFLATMSHEIRTPMQGVLSMLELLQRTGLDAEQREITEVVRDSASSLLKIIDDILDFSKIESGRLEIEQVAMSPVALVESVADALAPQAHKKQLQLTTFIDASVPPMVMGDPVRYRQVLFNLVGNAVKFTERGEVTIRLSVESSDPAGLRLVTRVTDTGVGLSAAAVQRLFQPFVQADGSTTRRFGGTGLGLSISRGLVERMGGDIGVESEPDAGSTFWFTILVGQSALAAPEEPDLSGLSILVVEDNRTVRDTLVSYLSMAGAQVELAQSGEAAIALCRRYHDAGIAIDAVIIDLRLPGIDGFDVQRALASGTAGPPRPCLMLTAYDEPDARGRALEAGFAAYFTKPVRRATLLRAIAIACGRVAATDHAPIEHRRRAARVPERDEALAGGSLVLVAEDNPTNQLVIGRQLAELGYACDIAENGRRAFDLFRAVPYGLVVTDIHMPEMDGLELATAVRELEAASGRAPVPIVALTADVVTADRERFLAAGIDECLRKPVELAQLDETLGRLLPVAASGVRPTPLPPMGSGDDAEAPSARGGAAATARVLDLDQLARNIGAIDATAGRLLQRFVETTRPLLGDVERAFAARAAGSLREAAHSIRGAARTAGAERLADVCAGLEDAMKGEDWAQAAVLQPRLAPAFGELEQAVAEVLAELAMGTQETAT